MMRIGEDRRPRINVDNPKTLLHFEISETVFANAVRGISIFQP